MARPRLREVTRLAREIHRCPDGYEGPCWGPTDADIGEAARRLTVDIATDPQGTAEA